MKIVTLLELRGLEIDLKSEVENVEYDEKCLAELKLYLPTRKQKVEAIRAELTEKLKIFKSQL